MLLGKNRGKLLRAPKRMKLLGRCSPTRVSGVAGPVQDVLQQKPFGCTVRDAELPRQGIERMTPGLEVQNLNYWPAGEVLAIKEL